MLIFKTKFRNISFVNILFLNFLGLVAARRSPRRCQMTSKRAVRNMGATTRMGCIRMLMVKSCMVVYTRSHEDGVHAHIDGHDE